MIPRRIAVRSHSAPRTPHAIFGGLGRLLLVAWLLAGGAAVHAQTPPGSGQVQIQITRPTAGERITSAEVLVTLVTTGDIALAAPGAIEWPGPGEFHILLDGVDVLQTTRLQFSLTPLPAGPHTLRIELQNWPGGTAPPVEVAFTVAPTPPRPGTSWWLAGTVAVVAVILLVSLSLLWLRWVRPVQANPVYDETDAAAPAPEDESSAN